MFIATLFIKLPTSQKMKTIQNSSKGVMYGCESWTIKKLSAEELMFLNCGVGEDS